MIVCYGDHEFSIFDSVSDHEQSGPGNDCELHEAEIVVSLDGHRGHYLGRDFIYEALLLLDIDNPDDTAILDKYEHDYMEEVEPGFTVAECVDEMVGEYESHLDDAGYLTEWNDGVVIVKIGDEIKPHEAPETTALRNAIRDYYLASGDSLQTERFMVRLLTEVVDADNQEWEKSYQ